MDNNNTMEYRIGLEKQNKRNDQVTELILDNCRASQISGLTDEFVNLETLSLINVGLVTLKGFPELPKLKKLELSDNRLTGGLNLLHGSPKLQHLNISGNRIKDFEALEPLKEFHDLVNLDLYNCEVTKADDYRKKVFDLLPNLHSLDGYDRNEREVADSDDSEDENSDVENRIEREDNDLEDEDEDEDDDDEEESDYEDEYAEDNFDDEEEGEDNEDDDDEDDDEVQEVTAENNVISDGEVEMGDEDDDDNHDDDEEADDDDDADDEDDLFIAEQSADLKQLPKDRIEEESSAQLSSSKLESSQTADTTRGQKRKHEDEGGDEKDDEDVE